MNHFGGLSERRVWFIRVTKVVQVNHLSRSRQRWYQVKAVKATKRSFLRIAFTSYPLPTRSFIEKVKAVKAQKSD